MQLMHWYANYADEKLTEQDNEFHDINKDKLIAFGMSGMGTNFNHNVKSGQFQLNENNICFLLNDKLIGKSSDVINFKEKIHIADFISGREIDKGRIIGYYTGFKENNVDFSYIEILFWVDISNSKLKLRLRLTPKENLKCSFNMIINGKLNERVLKFEELNKRKEFIFEI